MQARYKYGERAIGDYVVSGTESADDVLSVLLLARWANVTDRETGQVPLDVVPLLETVSALEGAGGVPEIAACRAELSPSPRGARRPADRAARLFGEQPGRSESRPRATRSTRRRLN